MRLLRTDTDELILEDIYDEYDINPTKYAILSHTWLADEEEVKFADLQLPLEELKARRGWSKVEKSKKQACNDGWKYIWIDTLCIDKSSSTELAEAINSMFRWYKKSQVCYAYLSDMPDPYQDDGLPGWFDAHRVKYDPAHRTDDWGCTKHSPEFSASGHGSSDGSSLLNDTGRTRSAIPTDALPGGTAAGDADGSGLLVKYLLLAENRFLDLVAFRNCRWFKRGWTLQEILAPDEVQFFSTSWTRIHRSPELLSEVSSITQIHVEALSKTRAIETYSIAQRMSWAAHRKTKRIEDRAYSLLGLFNINMGIIYGEGERAFRRLQEELLRESTDQTIFAFENLSGRLFEPSPLLAKSPSDFAHSSDIAKSNLDCGGRFQLTGPTMNFQAPTLYSNTKADSAPEGIILSCCVASDSSKYVVLNLQRQEIADGTSTHWVSERRISLIDVHYLHSRQQPRICSIDIQMTAQIPTDKWLVPVHHHGQELSDSLICRFQQNSGSVEGQGLHDSEGWMFADATPSMLWNQVNSSFHLSVCGNDRYEASIHVVSRSGEHLARLRIHGNRLLVRSRFSIRFDGGFLSLPWWCAHGKSLKWTRGNSIMTARSMYIRTLKGLVPVVEVGSTSPSKAAIDTLVSIVSWLAALVLSQCFGLLKATCISLISMGVIVLIIPREKLTDPHRLLSIGYFVSFGIVDILFDRVLDKIWGLEDLKSWFREPLDHYIPRMYTHQDYRRELLQKRSRVHQDS